MANSILEAYRVEDPSPHRHSVGAPILFAALLAAPVAWSIELLVNYALASHACFPREQPHVSAIPGWEGVGSALLAVNIVALVIACVAGFVSFLNWRRTREEVSGGHDRLLGAGEGRTRFIAVWGIWGGVWFTVAIVFNTISLAAVPLCGS